MMTVVKTEEKNQVLRCCPTELWGWRLGYISWSSCVGGYSQGNDAAVVIYNGDPSRIEAGTWQPIRTPEKPKKCEWPKNE
eukprot:4118446-Amphidinium_carterae.1